MNRPIHYTKPSIQRHLDVRAILEYLKCHPNSPVEIIEDTFSMSTSKVQKILLLLVKLKFVWVSEVRKLVGKSVRNYYSVLSYTAIDLDKEFPLARPDGYVPPLKRRNGTREWIPSKVQRDPLDTFLMGHGEAPSLSFYRSQECQYSQSV